MKQKPESLTKACNIYNSIRRMKTMQPISLETFISCCKDPQFRRKWADGLEIPKEEVAA